MPRIVLSLHIAVWLALTAVTAWVWAASDRAFRRAEVPSRVVVRQDVVYRTIGGHRLSLDIYQPPDGVFPAGSGMRHPAILAIHGGSWIGGSKRLFRPGPWNPHPTAIRTGRGRVRRDRGRLPAGPARVSVLAGCARRPPRGRALDPSACPRARHRSRSHRRLGQSAGAHLAALLGTSRDPTDDASSRVQAVVDFYGADRPRAAPARPVPAPGPRSGLPLPGRGHVRALPEPARPPPSTASAAMPPPC